MRYRFGVFEADATTGELRRQGLRVRLHAQPFQLLLLLLERPGELLSREEICRVLWPGETFVDFEHGVNSAVNRLREALGDRAAQPRFVETLARRGYRFLAPVERLESPAEAPLPPATPAAEPAALQRSEPWQAEGAGAGAGVSPAPAAWRGAGLERLLAQPADLPRSSPGVVRTLFCLLQAMYLAFYVGALANLPEISDLLSVLPFGSQMFMALVATAALLIPVRAFLLCGVLFRAPGLRSRYRRLWPVLLLLDGAWSMAPFLLLHHLSAGLALACVTLLLYAPFAQRSLMLMGAGDEAAS